MSLQSHTHNLNVAYTMVKSSGWSIPLKIMNTLNEPVELFAWTPLAEILLAVQSGRATKTTFNPETNRWEHSCNAVDASENLKHK